MKKKRFSEEQIIRPGKPVENAYVESFNGRFRDECLNEHWFLSMQHARSTIEAWRIEYNTERPHSSLDDLTPEEFRDAHASRRSADRVRENLKNIRIFNPGLHFDAVLNRGARQHAPSWARMPAAAALATTRLTSPQDGKKAMLGGCCGQHRGRTSEGIFRRAFFLGFFALANAQLPGPRRPRLRGALRRQSSRTDPMTLTLG